MLRIVGGIVKLAHSSVSWAAELVSQPATMPDAVATVTATKRSPSFCPKSPRRRFTVTSCTKALPEVVRFRR